jgi:hypothetical protein
MTDALTSFAIGYMAGGPSGQEDARRAREMAENLADRAFPLPTLDVDMLMRDVAALQTNNASLRYENSVLKQDVARLLGKIEEWRQHSDHLKSDIAELRFYADWAAAELGKRQGG